MTAAAWWGDVCHGTQTPLVSTPSTGQRAITTCHRHRASTTAVRHTHLTAVLVRGVDGAWGRQAHPHHTTRGTQGIEAESPVAHVHSSVQLSEHDNNTQTRTPMFIHLSQGSTCSTEGPSEQHDLTGINDWTGARRYELHYRLRYNQSANRLTGAPHTMQRLTQAARRTPQTHRRHAEKTHKLKTMAFLHTARLGLINPAKRIDSEVHGGVHPRQGRSYTKRQRIRRKQPLLTSASNMRPCSDGVPSDKP